MPERLLIALAAALAIGAGAASAQAVHAGGMAQGGAATRSVSRYLALERDLQQALAARDESAVALRVDARFEYRTPASPDVRDRQAWLRRVPHASTLIRDLTVSEDGEVSVVSFLADSQGRTRFVVDVWKGDVLLSRSSSLAPEAPRAPKRPSGRE